MTLNSYLRVLAERWRTIVVFVLINLVPGDPATFFVNPELGGDPAQIARVRQELGLDQPLPVRYLKWLGQTVSGDLGYRIKNGDRVSTIIWTRLQATLLLVGVALLLGIVVGIALGMAQLAGLKWDPNAGLLYAHLLFFAMLLIRPAGLVPNRA